ncbi:hypothetical protein NDU88_010032 [Pleurodeles waltl]|uniref:Uncharacterized protein n=1 Tax=Pleurodeles waltl TaxID=8319 RepID=A0AAV7QT78_PLEWA|nr:hypothetical protein NDU88_010032 [Pleurodeles waltl]
MGFRSWGTGTAELKTTPVVRWPSSRVLRLPLLASLAKILRHLSRYTEKEKGKGSFLLDWRRYLGISPGIPKKKREKEGKSG